MKRVLLLIPTTSYRAQAFVEAARCLGIEFTIASEKANILASLNPDGLVTIAYDNLRKAIDEVKAFAREHTIDAVVGVDDQSTIFAAELSASLGLSHNSVESVVAAHDKFLTRRRLEGSGVCQPRYHLYSAEDEAESVAQEIVQGSRGFTFPCVAKPLTLSASRGVIRANGRRELVSAFVKIREILRSPALEYSSWEASNHILIEEYIDGCEVALEGLLSNGRLRVLALFDKPDALVGPIFEETIYATPSRLPEDVQGEVASTTERAAHALGLKTGPIHAELRINSRGCWPIEIAARSIGGYCSRALRFVDKSDGGRVVSLEEILLRHALGMQLENLQRERKASGVMMIPVPRAGVLKEVSGLEEAKAVENIEDVVISIPPGERLTPLPEGGKYLGFIFSRAETVEEVEVALREAHRQLEFLIDEQDAARVENEPTEVWPKGVAATRPRREAS